MELTTKQMDEGREILRNVIADENWRGNFLRQWAYHFASTHGHVEALILKRALESECTDTFAVNLYTAYGNFRVVGKLKKSKVWHRIYRLKDFLRYEAFGEAIRLLNEAETLYEVTAARIVQLPGIYALTFNDSFGDILAENRWLEDSFYRELEDYFETANNIEADTWELLRLVFGEKPKDLGLMNDWKVNPPEYVNCVDHDLSITRKRDINWHYRYLCKECNITWAVDTSD